MTHAPLTQEQYELDMVDFVETPSIEYLAHLLEHQNQPYFNVMEFEYDLEKFINNQIKFNYKILSQSSIFNNSLIQNHIQKLKEWAKERFYNSLIPGKATATTYIIGYAPLFKNKEFTEMLYDLVKFVIQNPEYAQTLAEFKKSPRVNGNFIDQVIIYNNLETAFYKLDKPELSEKDLKPSEFLKLILGPYYLTNDTFQQILAKTPNKTKSLLSQLLFIDKIGQVFTFDESHQPIDINFNPVFLHTFHVIRTPAFKAFPENTQKQWADYFNDFKIIPLINYF